MVDEAKWALDVITLRWRPSLEAAVKKITGRLRREIPEPNDGEVLIVYCHAHTSREEIDSLIRLALTAVKSGTDQWRADEAALVRPRVEGLDAIVVCPWLGSTADLADEVASSMGTATRKKLLGQLRRARDVGYRTALAIDGRGHDGLKFGANYLPSARTVQFVVEGLERETNFWMACSSLTRTTLFDGCVGGTWGG